METVIAQDTVQHLTFCFTLEKTNERNICISGYDASAKARKYGKNSSYSVHVVQIIQNVYATGLSLSRYI